MKQARGIVSHFGRSNVGREALHKIQEDMGMSASTPQRDCPTRWTGSLLTLSWMVTNRAALIKYDEVFQSGAVNAVPNDDGSTYTDHKLTEDDFRILVQSVRISTTPEGLRRKRQGVGFP